MMLFARRLRATFLLALAMLIACGALPVRADWTLDTERWYVLEMQGHWAGYRVDRVYRDGGRIRTTQEQLLTLRRGPETTTLQASTEWIEKEPGKVEKIIALQRFGESPMVNEWTFIDGGRVKEMIRQADRERSREIDQPERPWLTPTEERAFLAQRMAVGATEIQYIVPGLEAGLPKVTVTWMRDGASVQTVRGKTVSCSVWKVKRSDSPRIEVTQHVSEDHVLVRSEEPFGPVEAVSRLATRDEALGNERPDDALAPEMLVEMFIKPDRPIRDLRRADAITCRVRATNGAVLSFVASGAQRVKKEEGGAAVVTVERGRTSGSTEEERENKAYLASSNLIGADDPTIRSFAWRAIGAAQATPEQTKTAAEALRLGVYRHIRDKGLATAFASASETVRSRKGDCSEHAVLLTAALRSVGIPSRIALGLVYAESFGDHADIFGWHMWSQALVDGEWVDLDATARGSFHPGHLLIATTAMPDDQLGPEFVDAFTLMGALEIEVLEVRYAEEPHE